MHLERGACGLEGLGIEIEYGVGPTSSVKGFQPSSSPCSVLPYNCGIEYLN